MMSDYVEIPKKNKERKNQSTNEVCEKRGKRKDMYNQIEK